MSSTVSLAVARDTKTWTSCTGRLNAMFVNSQTWCSTIAWAWQKCDKEYGPSLKSSDLNSFGKSYSNIHLQIFWAFGRFEFVPLNFLFFYIYSVLRGCLKVGHVCKRFQRYTHRLLTSALLTLTKMFDHNGNENARMARQRVWASEFFIFYLYSVLQGLFKHGSFFPLQRYTHSALTLFGIRTHAWTYVWVHVYVTKRGCIYTRVTPWTRRIV